MIIGWQNLLLFTGLSKQFLERATKLYNFPPATRNARQGKALMLVWDHGEVLAWMTANTELIDSRVNYHRRIPCVY